MPDESRIGEEVKALGERLSAGQSPPLANITTHAVALRRRRHAIQALATAVTALGVAVPLLVLLPLLRNDRAAMTPGSETLTPPPEVSPSDSLPSTATVVCDEAGTHTDTPAIQPQPDGVHLVVENETGERLTFEVAEIATVGAPPGTTETAPWQLGPGTLQVRCFRSEVDAPPPSPGGYVSIQVVDEKGLWKSPEISCERRVGFTEPFLASDRGEVGTPIEVATRTFQELARAAGEEAFPLPGDVIERAGYPEAEKVLVRVTRGQEVIGTSRLKPDRYGGWLVETALFCSA